MKDKKSTLVIIILVILLGLSVAYNFFGPSGVSTTQEATNFFEDVVELQSNLSYYIGASYSDTFGLYSKEEILLGVTEDGDKIEDNDGNVLPTLILEDSTKSYDDSVAYELDLDAVETTLSVNIGNYDGVTFYVVEGDLVKVSFNTEPDWWDSNYDGLLLD